LKTKPARKAYKNEDKADVAAATRIRGIKAAHIKKNRFILGKEKAVNKPVETHRIIFIWNALSFTFSLNADAPAEESRLFA
jgi:hypothetical protein